MANGDIYKLTPPLAADAQMTASGYLITRLTKLTLSKIWFITLVEPDAGLWHLGAGNKINHGNPELNASSRRVAKAALEALNGIDLVSVAVKLHYPCPA